MTITPKIYKVIFFVFFLCSSLKAQSLVQSTVYLDSVFANKLKITSQWNHKTKESVLSVSLDDETLINQWTFELPILHLSLRDHMLFGLAEDTIHVFHIHLEEATIHPGFIKYVSTLSFKTKDPLNPKELFAKAQEERNQNIAKVKSLSFELKHSAKAFANGLLASVPFDADHLVDAFGFDLNKDLEEQLSLYGVSDSISDQEKEDLKTQFSKWKLTGEMGGFLTQAGLLAKRIATIRRIKKIQTSKNIRTMNELRTQLGFTQSIIPKDSGTQWLKLWNAEELFISDVSPFLARLDQLKKFKILSADDWIALIQAIEKRKLYLRPLERVLTERGAVHLSKLERWTFPRIKKVFDSMDAKDLIQLFPPGILNAWDRLKRLESLEQLTTSQKVDYFSTLLKVKVGLLKAIQRTKGPRVDRLSLTEKTKKSLEWLSKKSTITPEELKGLGHEAHQLSKEFQRSHEAYRIHRILELNQKGAQLSELEKLEKMKLLIQSGLWKVSSGLERAEVFRNGETTLNLLDEIYDFEQMARSGYLSSLFKNGKLKETLLFTTYSDLANLSMEMWSRDREGRPLLSSGVAHNLLWNTYIMFPIFAISGLRLARSDKIFILILNSTSSSYLAQKMTKWGGELLDTDETIHRWYQNGEMVVPPPKMPVMEMPGYFVRDIWNPDPTFVPEWALFDAAWATFLSTPRGYGVSLLSSQLTKSRLLDREFFVLGMDVFQGVRQGVRMAPVFANESLGAATYTPIYQQLFFEDNTLKLTLLDAKAEVISPWETEHWEKKPKFRFFLAVYSSTHPEELSFVLKHKDKEFLVNLERDFWREIRENYYELTWEIEIPYDPYDSLYQVTDLKLKNTSRFVGSALNPFEDKKEEEGKILHLEKPLIALAFGKDYFSHELLKALTFLSKEAATFFYQGKPHFAAGIVYMIGQYLTPLYQFLEINESHNFDVDTFKEAVQITRLVNFTDYPITLKHIEHLRNCLDTLTQHSVSGGSLTLSMPLHPSQWLKFNTEKILSLIQKDILQETQGFVFDDGNKNDWYTFQLYKGYTFGLSKLFCWYLFHFQEELSQEEKDHINLLLKQFNFMSTYGKELEASWFTNLKWSDSYLEEFEKQFSQLEELLNR